MPDEQPHPDRLATQLLRVARVPATGRLVRGRALDIGLRAALFCDLILAGRLISRDGAPFVLGVEDTGDHVLDTLATSVHKRQNIQWWRWYRHVRVDRKALVKDLVADGRWTQRRGQPFPRFDDADELAPQALAARLSEVVRTERVSDAREGTLAVLTVICGTTGRLAQPRALRKQLKPIVDQIVATEEPGAEYVPSALAGATVFLRKPTRR